MRVDDRNEKRNKVMSLVINVVHSSRLFCDHYEKCSNEYSVDLPMSLRGGHIAIYSKLSTHISEFAHEGM